MDIKVLITWDVVGQNLISGRAIEVLDSVGREVFPNYTEVSGMEQSKLWEIDVAERDTISLLKSKIRDLLKSGESIQEFVSRIVLCSKSDQDLLANNWYIVRNFADDASNAEITHHTNSEIICPACGNKFQNAYFVPAIRPEKLPASPKLMSFYGPMKLFCREPFIEKYHKSGLTGFSFEHWEICDKHKVPLYLVRVQQHQWQDQTGVCDRCQMKTNVTTPVGLFNIHEQFKYDIQHVRTYRSDAFVISRRAVEFFRQNSRYMRTVLMPPSVAYPILPGYLEDVAWPEPKLFAHGDIPLHMLRSSWERSSE